MSDSQIWNRIDVGRRSVTSKREHSLQRHTPMNLTRLRSALSRRPRLWLRRLPRLARGRTNETELDTILTRSALPLGEAQLTAKPDALLLDLTATDAVNTTIFEENVSSRIEHFAFREELYFMLN